MDDLTLGDRELDVMAVLWELGSGTVNEVRDKLPASLAYPTALTTLRNLEAKGSLRHEEEGKAHRYIPRVAQQRARRGAIDRLVDKLFAGSTEELLAHLVEHKQLSAKQLEKLTDKLEAERRRRIK